MRGDTAMKKNSYLLTIVIAILTITNLHAENTLFGASGAHRSSTSATAPAAQMRSTSTLMYKQSTATPLVYASPAQTVKFNMPTILVTPKSLRSRRYELHSYGSGGGAGVGSYTSAITRRAASSSAVNFGVADVRSLPTLPKLVRSNAKASSGGGNGAQVMVSTASSVVKSGSSLSEAVADNYVTLYDAEEEETVEKNLRRGTRPGDWDQPYDDPEAPVGDMPLAMMAMLVAGYALCVRLRRKEESTGIAG